MKIIKGIHSYKSQKKPIFAAMGFFDGVHLGHRKVIESAISLAKKNNGESLVITFDVHPRNLLASGEKVELIYNQEEKIKLLGKQGIDNLILLYFGNEILQMEANYFYKKYLIEILKLKGLVVGFNFHYGKNKQGDTDKLKILGKENNCITKIIKPVKVNGQVISSTLIRSLIKKGDMEQVKKYLDRDFSVSGKVIRGHGIGRQYDTPTVNISVPHDRSLPQGVFYGRAIYGKTKKHCLINSGTRPTFNTTIQKLDLEAHILDFNRDVYGKTIRLEFIKKLRNEKKFKTPEALFTQIKKDINNARNLSEIL